jgi:tRNA A-37 threonylcarbamoyl transferase component Bud32
VAETPKKIGRYEIAERVGRGGMGVVYRGRDPVLDREVAIKVMHADFSDDESARPRFFREARAAARLQHRNIVTIFEFNEEDDVPYIAMEFLRGRSLSARVASLPPLTLIEKLDVVDQLCTGLSFAHSQGVVHRDVKPANVWIQDDGAVKLLDFGIAKVSSATMTRGADVMGSAPYMAPEQIEGKQVDGRADIFSAGVVLYELLSGRKPFPGESPTAVMMQIVSGESIPISDLVADTPAPLVAAVGRALQKSPDKRYARAEELAADLRLIRRSLQVAADLDSGSLIDVREAGTILAPPAPGETTVGRTVHAGDMSTTHYEPAVDEHAPGPAGPAESGRASLWANRRVIVGAAGAFVVLATVAGLWLTKRPQAPDPASDAVTPAANTTTAQPVAPIAEPARTVKLTSDPSGVTVTLDGKEVGVTPATITLAPGAPGVLRLTRRGFVPIETTVSAEQAKAGVASYRLESAGSVTLVATGSYPFEIREGQKVHSSSATAHEITLPGRRTVRLVAPAYRLNQTVTIDPAAGPRKEVTALECGVLKVNLRGDWQYCSVLLDGQDLGDLRSLNVVSGNYTVSVKCSNGQQESKSALIQENSTFTVTFQ